jgi:hypothetical protein
VGILLVSGIIGLLGILLVSGVLGVLVLLGVLGVLGVLEILLLVLLGVLGVLSKNVLTSKPADNIPSPYIIGISFVFNKLRFCIII